MHRRLFCAILALFCLLALPLNGLTPRAQSSSNQVVINQVSIPESGQMVDAYVSVIAPDGMPVSGLPSRAFTIIEDGAPVGADIAEKQVGLAIMILVDLSGSMVEPGPTSGQDRLESAKDVLRPFVLSTLHPDDWVGVIGFHVDTLFRQELTQDHGAVSNQVTMMTYNRGANTALLNAATHAIDELHSASVPASRRILLIFSDGKDYLEAQDQIAYQESREAVARKASEYGIPVYTVGIDSYCSKKGQNLRCVRNWPENAFESQDVAWLADHTQGGYIHYGGQDPDSSDREAVDSFLKGIASQGRQYHIQYPAHGFKGQHEIEVQVSVDGNVLSANDAYYSPFELPVVRIVAPADHFSLDLANGSTVLIEVEVRFPDSRPRDLERLILYDGGDAIATLTDTPYAYEWDASARSGARTLHAEGVDTVIRDRAAASAPVAIEVIPLPTATPSLFPTVPPDEPIGTTVVRMAINWLPFLLVVAVIALFVVLVGLRRMIAEGVKKTTTWVRRQTDVLRSDSHRAPLAKLLTQSGSQYAISVRHVTFGSDQNLCDELISNDRYISGKHFTIVQETDAFYIIDEESTNGTFVNGQRLLPRERTPLVDGTYIVVGQTQMQFRTGNVTVPLVQTAG